MHLVEGVALEDPRDSIALFVRRAAAQAQGAGIDFHLHDDFERYMAVNRACRDSWYQSQSTFDPAFGRLDRAFWIEARARQDGQLAATFAERLFVVRDGTLADFLAELRLFYDEPRRDARAGESCEVFSSAAKRMRGRISYNGGMWVHPTWRQGAARLRLSAVMARISRALSILRWRPDYVFGLAEPVIAEKGLVAGYGFRHVEPGVRWRGSLYGDDYALTLCWMDQPEMIQEINDFMQLADNYPLSAR